MSPEGFAEFTLATATAIVNTSIMLVALDIVNTSTENTEETR